MDKESIERALKSFSDGATAFLTWLFGNLSTAAVGAAIIILGLVVLVVIVHKARATRRKRLPE